MKLSLKAKWQAFKLYRRRKEVIEKLQSRKLWAAVVTGALAILFHELGVGSELTDSLIKIAGIYILGQGAVDAAKELGKGKPRPPEV